MPRPLHALTYQSNLASETFPTSVSIDASGNFVAVLGGETSAAGRPVGRFEGQLPPEKLAEVAAALEDPAFVAEPVQSSLVPGELFAKLDVVLGSTGDEHVGMKLLGETVAAGPSSRRSSATSEPSYRTPTAAVVEVVANENPLG